MRREDLHIPEPCHADWDEMTGDDRKRFCGACTKHVHNLSEMTHAEAAELLKSHTNLCVQYASHSSGEVFFRDSTSPVWRLHRQVEGTKKLLAAALSIPMLAGALAGCDAPDAPSPDAVAPVIQINPDGTLKAPGSGVAPTFTAPSTPPDEIEHLQGEPAIEPEEIEERMGDIAMPEEEIKKPSPRELGVTLGKVAIDHDAPDAEGESPREPSCDPGTEEDAAQSDEAHNGAIEKVGTSPSEPDLNILRGRMTMPDHKVKK